MEEIGSVGDLSNDMSRRARGDETPLPPHLTERLILRMRATGLPHEKTRTKASRNLSNPLRLVPICNNIGYLSFRRLSFLAGLQAAS